MTGERLEHQSWHEARGLLDAVFTKFEALPLELSPRTRVQYIPGDPMKSFREFTMPEEEPHTFLRVAESVWVLQENGFRDGVMNPTFTLPSHFIERYVVLGTTPSKFTSRPIPERQYLERYKLNPEYDRAINYLPSGSRPNLERLLQGLRYTMLLAPSE